MTRVSWWHISANTAQATRIHVGDWARLRVYQTRSSSRACSMTSPTTQVRRCKESVRTARKKWTLVHQDSDLVIGVSVAQDWNRPGHTTKLLIFACGEWDKFAAVMKSELSTSKHLVFQYSNMLQTGILTPKKTWIALQTRAAKQSHAREYGICVHSTLSVLRSEEMDSAQDASSASCLPQ